MLTHSEAFALLNRSDNILILTHRNPDGDAVGSMFALYYLLKNLGKTVRCIIDDVSKSLSFPVAKDAFGDFEPDFIVTVDVADNKLLTNDTLALYGERVDLAIDHHAANKPFSKELLLDSTAAAACEVLYDMIKQAGLEITPDMANSLYLGISTDTGCFRYPNTTARTLFAASELVNAGADNGEINRIVFETKTREYVHFEALAMNSLKTYYDGKCAVLVLRQDMFRKTGVSEEDTHGIAALPRQIEGVLVGIVIKERTDGTYKISMRTNDPVCASDICAVFGGGGHRLAAGCELSGTESEVVSAVLKAVGEELGAI